MQGHMSGRHQGTRVEEGGAMELPPVLVKKTRDDGEFLTSVKIQGGGTSVLLHIQQDCWEKHSSTLKDRPESVLSLDTEASGDRGTP